MTLNGNRLQDRRVSYRCVPDQVARHGVVSVSLHRMAITYQMSWSSSQACSHLACP